MEQTEKGLVLGPDGKLHVAQVPVKDTTTAPLIVDAQGTVNKIPVLKQPLEPVYEPTTGKLRLPKEALIIDSHGNTNESK